MTYSAAVTSAVEGPSPGTVNRPGGLGPSPFCTCITILLAGKIVILPPLPAGLISGRRPRGKVGGIRHDARRG